MSSKGGATGAPQIGEGRRPSRAGLDRVERSAADDREVASLVLRAKQHDQLAFADLYVHFVGGVQRYLSVALKNDDDAQEVGQEAFARALKALDGYDPKRGTFRDWLFGLVRNAAIDHLRKGSHERGVSLTEIPNDALPLADCAASLLERLDPNSGVRSIVRALPEMQRRVLTLRFLFGLNTTEIAKVTSATPAAVRQIQHRGLKALASRVPRRPSVVWRPERPVRR